MQDSAARRHPLGQAGIDHTAVAGGILVRQFAFQHPGHDLHVAVWVGVKSGAGLDDVVVVHQ